MPPAAEALLDRLDETRQRWWLHSMLCNVILTLVVSVGTLALFILIDVLGRLPQVWLATLLLGWVAMTVGLISFTIYRVVKYQRGLEAAARQVELSFPELGSNLITLVQLSQSAGDAPDDFRRAAINDAAMRAAQAPFPQAAQRLSRWWRWRLGLQTLRDVAEFVGALIAVFVVILALNAAFPKWPSSVDRLFAPWKFVPQVGSVEILEVSPGDVEVLAGSRLDISAKIAHANGKKYSATLYVEAADRTETAQTMFPNETADAYTFAFPAVLAPMHYRLEIGDTQSKRYAVVVHEKPTVSQVEVVYEYPSYLNRPAETVTQQHADLDAPQFTVAHLKLRCSTELSKGDALLENRHVWGQVDEEDRRLLTLDIPLVKPTTYTVQLFNEAGHTDPEPRINSIRVSPDAPPSVQLVKPTRESSVAPGKDVEIVVRGGDDHGLGQVRLEVQLASGSEAKPDERSAGTPIATVQIWDRLAGAVATTLSHSLPFDAAQFRPGQIVLLRAVARDRRDVYGGGQHLEPQESASPWHRIHVIDPQTASAEDLKRVEGIHARLWAILQRQIRSRLTTIKALEEVEVTAALAMVQDVRQSQVQIQTETAALSNSIVAEDGDELLDLKQALAKMAHGEMLRAVQQAEAAARIKSIEKLPPHVEPLAATQDQVIELLRRLLDQSRGAMAAALTEMQDRPGGDLPDDVADKMRKLQEKLEEFVNQQKRVVEATESLAKKPVEDFTEKEEQLLKELAAIEDDWARFLEDVHSDFSKLPEQDFSNPSLLQELVEVQTEIKMAKDALTSKTADIAVPLEQLGAEMAKELVTNIEKWLPDTPDRERWSQEEPLTEEMKVAPLAELPGELEDLVGELMEEEEDLFDEMEDVSSSWADSIDKGAGWDAADGPISNMSAKGVTGNRLPNTSEIGGRSGEGRQGKSSGEFVGDTAVGKGGRKTPSRLSPDPFVKGQVQDVSKDPVGGATGGGKESGVGGEGLEGPNAPSPQRDAARLAQKQADLRNRAEAIDLKFQVLNYHHTDLERMMEAMAAVEADLRSGRYQSALRRREMLVEGLGNMKTYVEGEFEVRRDQTANLPEEIQKELLNGMEDPSPRGWEEWNRNYFESLAGEKQE